MSDCKKCNKNLNEKQVEYCSITCAKEDNPGKRKIERVCSGCEKIEYVSNYTQKKRQCRSCSKIGNTSSQNQSKETREKIAAAKRGSTPWNKGKTGIYTEETKKAMGIKNKGRKYTKQQAQNHKQGLLDYYKENEHHNKGGNLTAEHKEKISHTLNNLEENVKKEINQRRSNSVKKYRKNLSEEQKLQQSKKISKALTKITNNEIWKVLNKYNLVPLFELPHNDEIAEVSGHQPFQCHCGRTWEPLLVEIHKERTRSCGCVKSHPEKDLVDFVKSIYIGRVQTNKRPKFMNGLELDIYLPEANLAIEYHGLAHHSERPVFESKDLLKVKTQHEEKYLLCKEADVKLIQIFEDEWRDKRPILESMIKNRLNICEEKIGARKLNFEQIEGKDSKLVEFFENTHISGYVSSICTFLLMSEEGEIYSALSIRKPWFAKKGEKALEIARFSSKLNTQVMGAFQRLMKMVNLYMQMNGFDVLYTFSDCRFGYGDVYLKAGFEYVGHSKPNYFYEKDGIRENRFKHRKSKKLEGETEREQQNNLDWYAIYDAGNEKFRLDLAKDNKYRISRVLI